MDIESILGRGIIIPFRRAGSDIVFADGGKLIESAIKQIILTRRGELRWRPDFGINLDPRRHQNMTETLLATIQSDVMEGLQKFEPRIEIENVAVTPLEPNGTKLLVSVTWRAVSRSTRANTVLTDLKTTDIEI